jgi:hypothetical protein
MLLSAIAQQEQEVHALTHKALPVPQGSARGKNRSIPRALKQHHELRHRSRVL